MVSLIHDENDEFLGLHWLLRLRWFAVLGQAAAVLFVLVVTEIRLPVIVLACCAAITITTNLWVSRMRSRGISGPWVRPFLIGLDIATLTVMLYFTGGANNPFTLFYLLHITIAVMILPAWAAWGAILSCAAGFFLLLNSPHLLESTTGKTCCNDMKSHLQGMLVSLIFTGSGVVYFVRALTNGLRESKEQISRSKAEGLAVQRRMETATLATAVAHELATPLGTIAIVSRDLELAAADGKDHAEDFRLIRQEVERCRLVIERLGAQQRESSNEVSATAWSRLPAFLEAFLAETIVQRMDVRWQAYSGRVMLPRERLLQCLAILVKNASEAAPADTRIVLNGEIQQDEAIFRVVDAGPGFAEELRDHLGEPLVTTKADRGGLGLGLYLVKTFVADFGGTFTVEPRPGSETIVTMRLPITPEKS